MKRDSAVAVPKGRGGRPVAVCFRCGETFRQPWSSPGELEQVLAAHRVVCPLYAQATIDARNIVARMVSLLARPRKRKR